MNAEPVVLVVDDEEIVCDSCARLLAQEGFCVETSRDSQKGLKMAAGKDYAAVLLDIKMPNLDGIEFLDHLRQERPNLPVIVITGYPNPDDAITCKRLGAFDYIAKPFLPDHLTECVKRTAKRRETPGEGPATTIAEEILPPEQPVVVGPRPTIIREPVSGIARRKTFPRGVHPPYNKFASRDCAIEAVPWPEQVVIPLQEYNGAPARLAVKPGQEVKRGDALVASNGLASAAVHSSVAGRILVLTTCLMPSGMRVPAVTVKTEQYADEELQFELKWELKQYLETSDANKPIDAIAAEDIVEAARAAGLVGMGGAAFPTHVKLKVAPNKPIDTVILNGCECEPFLTADDRIMRKAPGLVVRGLLLAIRATGARRGVIAIEDDKPEAIASITAAAQGYGNIELAVCPTKYPMGGERLLIPAVLHRIVPTDGLPPDIGVVVLNVATSLSLAHAVDRARPLTHRVLTVTGAVNKPGNFFVPLGTPISWLIVQAGGLRDDAAEVIMGGPMMGVTMPDLSAPVTKATSGITVLSLSDLERREQTACIKCGRCVDHCPLRLAATKIAHAVKFRNLRLARSYNLMACCECGCCGYVCPAHIPLVQYIKSGKAAVTKTRAKKEVLAAKQG